MNKLDIAKQLAAITGKPITDFFKGEIDAKNEQSNEVAPIECEQETDINGDTGETESDTTISGDGKILVNEESQTEIPRPKEAETRPEVKELAKIFDATKIVNNKIMDGRQMTRKEYLSYSKGLTEDEVGDHPLVFKMFRSEDQGEANFLYWLEKFPKAVKDDN